MSFSYGGDDLVTVVHCYTPADAHMYVGLLHDNGIETSIADEANVSWFAGAAYAYGGVRVMVRVGDEEKAREILAAPLDTESSTLENVPEDLGHLCPSCGSSEIHDDLKINFKTFLTIAYSAFLGIFLLLALKVHSRLVRPRIAWIHWTCDTCGHRWEET